MEAENSNTILHAAALSPNFSVSVMGRLACFGVDMIKLSAMSEGMIYAHGKGYRVNKKGELINPSGKVLKGTKDRDGYLGINIRLSHSQRKCCIHRLAAYQKYGGAMFEPGIEVRHLNGNPSDNNYDNIAIGTISQNRMDMPEEARKAQCKIAWVASAAKRQENLKAPHVQ